MVIRRKIKLGFKFHIECQKAVETAKLSYLRNMGNKLGNPGTSQKSYWEIINRVVNKGRAPKIPPLINNQFILDCREKAKRFNELFSQRKPITNSSVLPNITFLTNKRIDQITSGNDEINSLIRNINLNKATGSDDIWSNAISM